MKEIINKDSIYVKELNLWAHVGFLEEERLQGQKFIVDFSLWVDLNEASEHDQLSSSIDYSLAIIQIQKLAQNINCKTIEYFSSKILDCLEDIYGSVPMKLTLTKSSPPINGFNGSVGVERSRHFSNN